jgi:hypothetical protein
MQLETPKGTFDVASNGKANAALTTGIIGTVGTALGSGLLGNLFGNNCNQSNEDTRKIGKLEAQLYSNEVGINTFKEAIAADEKLANRIAVLENFAHEADKKNAVLEAVLAERLNCMNGRISAIEALTKLVIPNGSVCPGWGNVTITPAAATTGA